MDQPNATTKCPSCGANMKAFWHTLTPGLVSILVKAIQWVHEKQQNKFHPEKDLHLTYTQHCNFTKLRQHGLVAHFDKDNPKSGYWLITARGGQFLRGEISVPMRVKTFRNRTTEHSPEQIHIKDLRGKVPYFEQEFAYEYQRPKVPAPQAGLFSRP